jgi:hypothetical protein
VAPGGISRRRVCPPLTSQRRGVDPGHGVRVDPNGDGDTSDHLDIVNMSSARLYGQSFDDDLSRRWNMPRRRRADGCLLRATRRIALRDRIATATLSALVAQTEVPSAFLPLMQVLTSPAIAGRFRPSSSRGCR